MTCEASIIYAASNPPNVVQRSVFEVTYDETTITLPAPDLSDRLECKLDRIQRKTPNGVLVTHIDATWGSETVYKYTFSGLTQEQRDDFVSFLQLSLGQPVIVVDHQSLTYTGLIRNPNGDIGTYGLDCKWTCVLEIEKI